MPLPPPVSRRAVLGGLGAVAAPVLAACTGAGTSPATLTPGVDTTPEPRGTGRPGTDAGTTATPAPDADVALAAAVLTAERDLLDRVRATARRHRRLAPVLSGATSTHRAHVALLVGAVPDAGSSGSTPATGPTPRPARVPARRGAALAAVVRAEERLTGDGRRWALAADSGDFARLLASMAAASAQQAAVLGAAR